ncbi:MAG TPA: acetyl-CoA carboxylase biotin carboxyl carrier protein [Acidobacteriota bacterium]|jgi:acetyl-CoA carboxylase biotin carboxyl carrier protein
MSLSGASPKGKMNLKEIKELVEFVVRQELNEFEYEQSGFKIKIRRGLPVVVSPAPFASSSENPAAETSALPAATRPAREAAGKTEVGADVYIVKSPIVGTFYRSASPDAEAFSKVGDMVEKGSVLCIIEAMKLMNEIESEVAGEVVEIYVENGNPVEYGQPLFAIRTRS